MDSMRESRATRISVRLDEAPRMCAERRSRTESTAESTPPPPPALALPPRPRGRSLPAGGRPVIVGGADAAEKTEGEPEDAGSMAETGREPPGGIGESGLGAACEASHRSRPIASASNLERSYVGLHVWRRATSARFSTSMRSRSCLRRERLRDDGSTAAPNLVVSWLIQWSMTGTWLGVRRSPPVQSRVLFVGLRDRRRIFESLARSTVFSSSISAKRSSWIWARLRLARTCGYAGCF